MPSNQHTGRKGEELAARFIEQNGLEILERNWSCRFAEADIIAKDGDILVFIEVKTRTSETAEAPEFAVNYAKEERMIEAAEAYLEEKGIDLEVRFDIISIILNPKGHKINHIQEAF